MEVSGQLHTPAGAPWGNSSRYALYRRLGEFQSWSGRGGEEKKPKNFKETIRKMGSV